MGVIVVLTAVLLPCPGWSQNNRIELRNVVKQINANSWEWLAFITSSPGTLSGVKCVEYTLHPTFPNPVRRVCTTKNPKFPFALKATGGGTFNLRAKVEFKDGPSQELAHTLDFSEAAKAQFEDD